MAPLVPTVARLVPAGVGSTLAGAGSALARAGCGPAVICGNAAVTVKKNACCITTVQVLEKD